MKLTRNKHIITVEVEDADVLPIKPGGNLQTEKEICADYYLAGMQMMTNLIKKNSVQQILDAPSSFITESEIEQRIGEVKQIWEILP